MSTIYLAGPMEGCTDSECRIWREYVKRHWRGQCLDPMRRDYRWVNHFDAMLAAAIVDGDLEDIRNSDALLVYFDRQSTGTSMEIAYAYYVASKPIVTVVTEGFKVNPWVLHHSMAILPTFDDAIDFLSKALS